VLEARTLKCQSSVVDSKMPVEAFLAGVRVAREPIFLHLGEGIGDLGVDLTGDEVSLVIGARAARDIEEPRVASSSSTRQRRDRSRIRASEKSRK